MDYLRALFGGLSHDPDDVEVRSHVAFSLFAANHYIAAKHGGRSRSAVMDRTAEWLLAPGPAPDETAAETAAEAAN